MAEDNRDILMKLEMTKGSYVPAECSAVLDSDDPLATDFKGTGTTGSLVVGNYFAIEEFSFDIGLADREKKPASVTPEQMQEHMKNMQKAMAAGKTFEAKEGSYKDFMKTGRGSYPADLQAVSITKSMDRSSTTLFEKVQDSFKFVSATILRRKAIGADTLRGYLRIDFTDVMLTELNWEDDEVVKETFKFVCRGATIKYAMESGSASQANAAANVLKVMPEVKWSVRPPQK